MSERKAKLRRKEIRHTILREGPKVAGELFPARECKRVAEVMIRKLDRRALASSRASEKG